MPSPSITPGDQRAALREVLRRAEEVASANLTPVVEIDLDLTALCPRSRSRRALAKAAARFGVAELEYPQPELAILPGYTAQAWAAFLAETGLPARHPGISWGGDAPNVYSVFHDAYWTTDWLVEDEPAPGLGEFVRQVEDRGGKVVFLSGRWRLEQVPPSLAALRRAGIPAPVLLIGNPRHEENVRPGEDALSDAEVKALAQEEIRTRHGVPVAVFDDRLANREAVIAANPEFLRGRGLPPMVGVGVTVPGFSHDPATDIAPLRISSFESCTVRGADPRREPYLAARYAPPSPDAPYLGLIGGLGRNGRGYVLPRIVAGTDGQRPPSGYAAHFAQLAKADPESLTAEAFMETVERTIPEDVRRQLESTLNQANAEAGTGLAAPFPDQESDRKRLWHTLACSWLHSRDLEVVMAAIGYPLPATGVHDMQECAPAEDVIAAIIRSLDRGKIYSDWFLRWVRRLDRRGAVNVDFLNPSLTVSTWLWKEGVDMPQDAMDVHRVSSHHEGDGEGRYDPVEATVNNLLHAREGVYGVQKKPAESWTTLEDRASAQVGAAALAKSSWGGVLLRDAIPVLKFLEQQGYVMPWGVVKDMVPAGT